MYKLKEIFREFTSYFKSYLKIYLNFNLINKIKQQLIALKYNGFLSLV